MFTLKIKRDRESPDGPGSELWIADIRLVSNLGSRSRRDVMAGCWSAYEARMELDGSLAGNFFATPVGVDYGQSIHTPVMRPVRELAAGDCVYLGDGLTQADGSPVPSGVWKITRHTLVTMVVPAVALTASVAGADSKPVVELRIESPDGNLGDSVTLDVDKLVSTSPLVPNPDLTMTLLYVEQAGVGPWWCIAQTAWLLGPDGQTIERVAP